MKDHLLNLLDQLQIPRPVVIAAACNRGQAASAKTDTRRIPLIDLKPLTVFKK